MSNARVAWSPDGKRLATGSWNQTPKVWDAETGKELLTLSGVSVRVWSLAWSLDGQRLAAGEDNTAKVWDAETGKELLTLSVGGSVSVAWSPDGKRLATASARANVWDAETGKELLTLTREQPSAPAGPAVTLGIEISLPSGGGWPVGEGADHAVFYIPAVGKGEMLGVIAVPNGRFAGVRITPSMGENSVKIDVSALVRTEKKLSEVTCNEVRSWPSEDAGSYGGKKDESLSLSGLARLGLPVFRVKVVQVHGPMPGDPYANFSAHCDCDAPRDAFNLHFSRQM